MVARVCWALVLKPTRRDRFLQKGPFSMHEPILCTRRTMGFRA